MAARGIATSIHRRRAAGYALALALLAGLAVAPPALARESGLLSDEELAELDLEELLQVRVVVASKREESRWSAPAVATVVTAEDIRRYGARDLRDVLRRTPGLFPLTSSVLRENSSSLRGQHSISQDRHLLWLIDGRPFRDSFFGGAGRSLYEAFPLDLIERLEIVRGPGSVLYGSNAFSGVVNIVTKRPDPAGDLHVAAGYGSFETYRVEGLAGIERGDARGIVATQITDSDGWTYAAVDAAGVAGSGDYGNRDAGVAGRLGYGDLAATFFIVDDAHDHLGTAPLFPIDRTGSQRSFVDLSYTPRLSEDWALALSGTFNALALDDATDDRSLLAEGTLAGEPFEGLHVLLGGTYTNLRVEDDPSNPFLSRSSATSDWYSGYLQADLRPLSMLKLVGGLQINATDRYDPELSPRGGVIVDLTPRWGVKLLYGEAFRSPYLQEIAIALPGVVIGNEDLVPETIRTFDAQLFYRAPGAEAAVSYYRSWQRDTVEIAAVDGEPTFVNGGSLDYQGVELEGRVDLASLLAGLEVQGSVSYQQNEDDDGNEDVQLVPRWHVKAGASWAAPRGVTIGVFDSWFSAPQPQRSPATLRVNPEGEAYHHLSAHLLVALRGLLESDAVPPLELSVYGDNLLEEDPQLHPDVVRASPNTLPIRAGRSVHGTVALRY